MSEKLKTAEIRDTPEVARLSSETIVDQLGVERSLFSLDEQTKVIFRGQEELPDLRPTLLDQHLRPSLLSQEQKPLFCSDETYQSWQQDFEPLMADSSSECLVALASPLGVVDLALHLSQRSGQSGQISQLIEMKSKLSHNLVDEQVEDLYDTIFAACSVLDEGQNRQDGLMEVALALSAQPAASEVLARKRLEQSLRDQHNLVEAYGSDPNQPASPAAIESLRDNGFVAVHTTSTEPVNNRIYPTALYTQQTKDCAPRITVHFSLNHTVDSHLFGNFEGRDYTVVSPMADLVELSGKPDALKDVDTFFSVEASHGLELPETSLMVSQTAEQDRSLVIDGNRLSLRVGSFDHHDLGGIIQSLEDYGVDGYQTEKWLGEAKAEIGDGCRRALVEVAELGLDRDQLDACLKAETDSDDIVELGGRFLPTQYVKRMAESQRLLDDLGLDSQSASEIVDGYLSLGPEQALSYPIMTKAIQEGLRTLVTKAAIDKLGGKVVAGGQHYSSNSHFRQSVEDSASLLGVRGNWTNHNSTPEAYFERFAWQSKQDSYAQAEGYQSLVPRPDDSMASDERDTYLMDRYHKLMQIHTAYDSLDNRWHDLQNLKPAWRHIALQGDFLPYALPQRPLPPDRDVQARYKRSKGIPEI